MFRGGASLHALCRLESTFEPIFAELALYDVKERRKVSILLYAAKFAREKSHNLNSLCTGVSFQWKQILSHMFDKYIYHGSSP